MGRLEGRGRNADWGKRVLGTNRARELPAFVNPVVIAAAWPQNGLTITAPSQAA
jgi:hypothetical protein